MMRSVIAIAVLALQLGCAGVHYVTGSGGSGDSSAGSGGSGNSSAGSGGSGNSSAGSGASGNSSAGSGDSGSGNSSAGSGDSAQSSGNSGQSSAASSGQSVQSSAATTDATAAPSVQSSNDTARSSANSSSSRATESGRDSAQATAQSAPLIIAPVISTTVVGATAAIVGLVIWGLNQADDKNIAAANAAESFFRVNARQLRHDLARGAGPSIEDLAAAAEIRRANLPRFSKVLHANRAAILELVDPERLDAQRALDAMNYIGEIARADPSLDEDYQRFRLAHAEAR